MTSILLVTPVHLRFELTRILLEERVRTFERARRLGVECRCVVIGDDANLDTARGLGFETIEAPNVLGRRYNDGHEHAVREGFDFSFQVNSDQVFDPRLLAAIAVAPRDRHVATRWLTAVHRGGERAIVARNPIWAMKAYPAALLARAPRPCPEHLERGCDRGVHEGVAAANPGALTAYVEVGPLETIQFESDTQLTPWSRNQKVALADGTWERPVPWTAIAAQHGLAFAWQMQEFYEKENNDGAVCSSRHGR